MHLENIAIDAGDPALLGRFWATLLGAEVITDEPDLLEARLVIDDSDGSFLDLCLPRVPEPVTPHPRLHLDLQGGRGQQAVVERAVQLGGRLLDIGQEDVPWVVLQDPEGNPFCVMEHRPEYERSGPVAALPLHSADPDRDLEIWRYLSGWVSEPGSPIPALRHPSGYGPLLEICHERRPRPEGAKNRLHLDARLAAGDDGDEVAERVRELGGGAVDHDWGELPWRVLHDASGNEVCVLPARS